MRISVAIDGPAGAGKSTIAKIIAKKYNLMYINTGSMYRAVTLKALENNIDSSDIDTLCNLVDNLNMHFENDRLILNEVDINDSLTLPHISKNVSAFASIKEVRERLVKEMQNMSKKFNVIMDGRDIGTVVLKDAPFKFFLTATPDERAKRRFEELKSKGIDMDYNEILEDIKKRDFIDSTREIDPLKKADDALEIDTTGLDINGVVDSISKVLDTNIN